MMTIILLTLLSGLGAGILSGLLGVGGGIIMVPILVFLLGLTQHAAQGISLVVIIPTALTGVYHLHKDKLVNYRVASYLAAGAVVGALISANFVQMIPGDYLRQIFGVFIIYTGAQMILTKAKR